MFNASKRLLVLVVMATSVAGAFAQNGTLRFNKRSYSIAESGSAAKITVTRSGGSAGEVTVSFATIDSGGGTATADLDYYPTNGSLTFGPGVTSRIFYVPIINDAAHEGSETVLLELREPTGGAGLDINNASATLTIADNDACVYSLSSASLMVNDRGGLAPAIMVAAPEGCGWSAAITSTDAPWLGIFTGTFGQGNGVVVLSVDPNPSASSRAARLRIAGKSFTITQLGVPPPDVTPPTIAIRSPAANSRQTNDEIMVTGTARDDVRVVLVEVRVENEAGVLDYVTATGAPNWQATVNGLIPGTNTIRVRAFDAANPPTEATLSVVFVEVRPLTVVTNGSGFITPLRDRQPLDVGRTYTVQARPARRHFFTGWSGSMVSGDNPLAFTMQPNFRLEGNFVPSPFFAVAGSYNGLFSEAETNRHENSGFLTIRLAGLGAFSAKMILGGQRMSFSGTFGLDGRATNEIARTGAAPLTVVLAVDLTGCTDQITGTISESGWASAILAHRARFHPKDNPAPQRGRYTIVIPGEPQDPANQPGGDSFGTVNVDAGGKVRFSGTLADGTKVSQGVPLSKEGWWPLYGGLYGGGGSIRSWVVFAESSEANFTGELFWIKPALANAKFYTNGFVVRREFSGSSYRAPTDRMDPVLNFSSGKVAFTAGNLAEDFENPVLLEDNKVTDNGTNNLKLSLSLSSGLFSGSVLPPGDTRRVSFRGALHQKQNRGSGFFLGTEQSGRLWFSE